MTSPSPQITTLDNGIRVVTDPMPEARSVTTGVWVGVGGRDEAPSIAGVSHFLEHLFFKGTERRSARQIAETVDAVGGDLNAFTSREHTAFHTRLPASEWRLGVELLGDILSAPALRQADIDAEREVILEELWAAMDTPEDLVHMLASDGVFPAHPLGREVLGDADTVRAMHRDDIAAFFERHYRPANLVVAAAGRVSHDEFCDAVATHLDLAAGGATPEREVPGEDVVPLHTHERPGEQVHLVLGWRGLPSGHDDRYALAVANQILGGGSSSRLFQTIREDRGLAYTVYSWIEAHSDAGMLGTYVGTSPGRSAEVLETLEAELAAIAAGGATDDEFRVAVGYLAGATELGLEDSGSRMGRIGRMLLSTGTVVDLDDQLARLRAVTIDEVDALLARLLATPRTVAAVGPVDAGALASVV